MPKVYVIYENSTWVESLRDAAAELGTPFEEWFLDQGVLDLRSAPPEGVFYNRMIASSDKRGHHLPLNTRARSWLGSSATDAGP